MQILLHTPHIIQSRDQYHVTVTLISRMTRYRCKWAIEWTIGSLITSFPIIEAED